MWFKIQLENDSKFIIFSCFFCMTFPCFCDILTGLIMHTKLENDRNIICFTIKL